MDLFCETDFKDKLSWPYKRWLDAGTNLKGMKRLVNSVKYWRGRLQNALKDNNVIFTLYHGNENVYPSLQKTAEAIYKIDSSVVITGYAKFRNRRFLSVSFQDSRIKNIVAENLKLIDECNVVFLHWVDEVMCTTLTVDWLSNETDFDIIVDYVSQYMEIDSAMKMSTEMKDGTNYISGKVVFKGKIKKNVLIDNIPYLDYIDGLECHIIVEGRPYRCFTCSKVGHRASQCLMAFCVRCKKILYRSHACIQMSYGAISQGDNGEHENGAVLDDFIWDEKNEIKEKKITENLFFNNNLVFTNQGDDIKSFVGLLEKPFGNAEKPMQIEDKERAITNNSVDRGFSNFGAVSKERTNHYMTEEVSATDPNFILIDTSSEESSNDSEYNTSFLVDKAEECMSDLARCAHVSRSLLENSFIGLKAHQVEKREATEDINLSVRPKFSRSNKEENIKIDRTGYMEELETETVNKSNNNRNYRNKKKKKNRR